jgi:hypothetical protein
MEAADPCREHPFKQQIGLTVSKWTGGSSQGFK